MQEYGLVSIGSHTGFWLKEELKKFSSKKNILIEPVPYNIVELKENIKERVMNNIRFILMIINRP